MSGSERQCRECGNTFVQVREWQKDCSKECHGKYRKKVYKQMVEALKKEQGTSEKEGV